MRKTLIELLSEIFTNRKNNLVALILIPLLVSSNNRTNLNPDLIVINIGDNLTNYKTSYKSI